MKPIPKDRRAALKEGQELGLFSPNFNLDTGRKQLLSHIWSSYKIKRSTSQVSIVLIGSSGVGKSSTINHLFNCDIAKIHKSRSETRSTTEYIIESDSDQYEASGLKMALVDTPGFTDTGGSKQDACNFSSIKRFYESHPTLKGFFPNLVFILISAADARLEGPCSDLTRSLKSLSQLNLVDRQHPNVIGIITRADFLGKRMPRWKTNFDQTCEIFRNAVFEYLEVPPTFVPIVPIDNDLEDREREDDWTLLIDGTKQPRNLFKACGVVLKKSGDPFGKIVLNACFVENSNPHQGLQVKARVASETTLSHEENRFHNFLEATIQGGSENPLMCEATKYIETHKLKDQHKAMIQSLVTGIISLGLKDKAALQVANINALRFHLSDVIGEDGVMATNFLLDLGVKDLAPSIMNTVGVIGQGYNIMHENTVPDRIFHYETEKDTQCGFLVPEPVSFTKVNQSVTFMDTFESEGQMVTARMRSLNVSMDVDVKTFSMKGKFGYNTTSASSVNSSSSEISVLNEQRLFELSFTDYNRATLSKEFQADVKDLPNKYNLESDEDRLKFRRFFDRWGHFFVRRAYGGGSIEVKINKSSLQTECSDEYDMKAKIMASFSAAMSPLSFSGTGACESGGLSSSKSERLFSQSSCDWRGGDTKLQSEDTMNDWKLSLATHPVMLQHDLSLLDISEIVKRVDKEKSLECRKALESLLGGKFRLQKDREAEREQKRFEEERENAKAEDDEKTRQESAKNQKPEEGNNCFPGSSLVSIYEGDTMREMSLKNLQVGQLVMTNENGKNKPSRVVTFLHTEPQKESLFLKIKFDNGGCLNVSKNHLLMVKSGKCLMSKTASEVRVGDNNISLKIGERSTVISVEQIPETGVFCPLTESGTLFVDGVLVSCYATTDDFKLPNFQIGHWQFSGHQVCLDYGVIIH